MRLAILLCLIATPAFSVSLPQGRFDGADCGEQFSELTLTITGSDMRFYESRCTVENATEIPGLPGVFRYDASCGGEGQTWSTGYIVAPTWNDGVVLIREGGTAIPYERCEG